METIKEEVVRLTSESTERQSYYFHRKGSHDYSTDRIEIDKIVDREGRPVEGVWNDQWTEIAQGIETRLNNGLCSIRIHRKACPVRVRYWHFFEYVSYDDPEYCKSDSHHSWKRFECATSEGAHESG